jgi:hypothetical protein
MRSRGISTKSNSSGGQHFASKLSRGSFHQSFCQCALDVHRTIGSSLKAQLYEVEHAPDLDRLRCDFAPGNLQRRMKGPKNQHRDDVEPVHVRAEIQTAVVVGGSAKLSGLEANECAGEGLLRSVNLRQLRPSTGATDRKRNQNPGAAKEQDEEPPARRRATARAKQEQGAHPASIFRSPDAER